MTTPARVSAEAVEAILARHTDFETRYSPGPDWEPYNQTHRDRGMLLVLLAAAEAEAARLRAVADAARPFALDVLHAGLYDPITRGYPFDINPARDRLAVALRALLEPGEGAR